MNLTTNEKEYLKKIVEKELKEFEAEGKTIVVDEFPEFIALEVKYDEFLRNLLNKLKQ